MEICRFEDNLNNIKSFDKCKICDKLFNSNNSSYVVCSKCYNDEKEKRIKHNKDFIDKDGDKEYYYYYCLDCNDNFCNIHIQGYDDYPIYHCPLCGVLCNSIKLDYKPENINNIIEV